MTKPAILALADGSIFHGDAIGVDGETVGEVVFDTAMTGYQEMLTDPASSGQLLAFTYPHIGNSGINEADHESGRIHAAGLIIRDLPLLASNWRSTSSLPEFLQQQSLVAIANIDTRHLTRLLREKGSLAGCIIAGDNPDVARALELARSHAGPVGRNLTEQVSTAEAYDWTEAPWQLASNRCPQVPAEQLPWQVTLYDFGVTRSLLRDLVAKGCRVRVVPASTPVAEVLAANPAGVVLSGGPGDASVATEAIQTARQLLASGVPLLGIGFGHQLLALASGARITSMKNSRQGANQPVRDLNSGQTMITRQHHGFVVCADSLPDNLRQTHVSLFDHSVQGIERSDVPAIGFQGVPVLSAEPNTSSIFFDRFVELMKQAQKA